MWIVLGTYVGTSGNPREAVLNAQQGSPADPCGRLARLAPILVAALPS